MEVVISNTYMVGCDYGMAAGADLAYANKHAAAHIVPDISGFQ
jgi:hypothetical protein